MNHVYFNIFVQISELTTCPSAIIMTTLVTDINEIKLSTRVARLRPLILGEPSYTVNILKVCVWRIAFVMDDVPQLVCSGILDISADVMCYKLNLERLLESCSGSVLKIPYDDPPPRRRGHNNYSHNATSTIACHEYAYRPVHDGRRWIELEHLIDIVENGDTSIAPQELTKIKHADNMLHIHDLRF